MKQSNVELDERVAVSHRRVRVSMRAAKSCLMQDRGQSAGGQGARNTQRPGAAPPPESRPFRVYLTLRVLSSLDQESVEGKEGRDEEEVTSALLPI